MMRSAPLIRQKKKEETKKNTDEEEEKKYFMENYQLLWANKIPKQQG